MTKKCECKEPIIQPQTRRCGRCNLYIDRVRHILLTNIPLEDVEFGDNLEKYRIQEWNRRIKILLSKSEEGFLKGKKGNV